MSMFENLMKLCENPDHGFYFVDHVYEADAHKYRVFSYRLVGSYSMWLLPDALNCRGTMFRQEMNGDWTLVCLPMPKCFRLGENPIIMEQEKTFANVLSVYTKHDGSLISTFIDANGNLGVKSKTSLTSLHAKTAKRLIDRIDWKEEYNIADLVFFRNNTFSFELTSDDPELRIVLKYIETSLQPLNIRHHDTGKVTSFDRLRWAATLDDIKKKCEVRTLIEGYIVHDKANDVYFKMKTRWYDVLHSSKFSFSVENVVKMTLEESIDDYLSIHSDDIGMQNKINSIVDKVVPVYNHLMSVTESFYEQHKSLCKKDFAILAKSTFNGVEFTLLINKYLQRNSTKSDVVDIIMKHWKDIFKFTEPEDKE